MKRALSTDSPSHASPCVDHEEVMGGGVESLSTGENLTLSPDFLSFIAANDIPSDAYNLQALWRYLRINPRGSLASLSGVEAIATALGVEVGENGLSQVPWFPQFYRLPSEIGVSTLSAYKAGTFLFLLCPKST